MITSFLISKFESPINFEVNDPININWVITIFKPDDYPGSKNDLINANGYARIAFEIARSNRRYWCYKSHQDRDKEYEEIINIVSIKDNIIKVNVVDNQGRTIGNG